MADIVFIDSGTGGIPYLTYFLEKNPFIDCAYVADNKNFPYGEKSHEEIVSAVIELCKNIKEKLNPKVIVIACNTMSVNVLDVCREVFPEIQFVGTVPAIKVAGEISKKRRIGLLATTATVNHPYNQDLKTHFASDCELILRADPDLISFIEHESFTATNEEREKACLPAVNYFREKNCDVIILGCTHFLNIASEMQKVCGQDIKVVDSKDGVVNRAISILNADCRQGKTIPSLFTTAETDKSEYDVICNSFELKFEGLL